MSGFAEYRPSTPGRATLPVVIRSATEGDLAAIAEVQRESGRAMHADAIRRALVDVDRCVLVADLVGLRAQDGVAATRRRIAGWAQTWLNKDPQDAAPAGHYLAGVTVAPEHRRRGVADALTSARLCWASQRASEIYLVVNALNLASIRLHTRRGFIELLRADQLTGVAFTGGEGILMRAPLSTGSGDDTLVEARADA